MRMWKKAPKQSTPLPEPRTVRDLRRGQILHAARTLVAQQGLEALTIGALEDRLEYTRGVISYHFKNKDELEHALLDAAVAEIEAAVKARVAAAQGTEGRILVAVDAMVRGFLERNDAAQVMLAFWSRIRSDRKARAVNAALYARYRKQSLTLLRQAPGTQRMAPEDLEALSAVLVGVVLGIATQCIFQPGAVDVDRAIAQAAACVLAHLESVNRAAPLRAAGKKSGAQRRSV